jgi:hypothetical protein
LQLELKSPVNAIQHPTGSNSILKQHPHQVNTANATLPSFFCQHLHGSMFHLTCQINQRLTKNRHAAVNLAIFCMLDRFESLLDYPVASLANKPVIATDTDIQWKTNDCCIKVTINQPLNINHHQRVMKLVSTECWGLQQLVNPT